MIFKNINSRAFGEVLGSKCLFLGTIYIFYQSDYPSITGKGSRTEVRGVKYKFSKLKNKKYNKSSRRRINPFFKLLIRLQNSFFT